MEVFLFIIFHLGNRGAGQMQRPSGESNIQAKAFTFFLPDEL
jgi:hypothetical protein